MNAKYLFLLFFVGLATANAQESGGGTKEAPKDKKYQTNIDAEKGEGTMNLNKAGDFQVGGGKLDKRPDGEKSEAQKRQDQQESGGKVFLRKTFP